MIQRKQTLFLFFSAVIMIAYLFAPVIRISSAFVNHNIAAKDLAINVNFPVIGRYFVFVVMIAALIAAGLNLIAILLYKMRGLQIFMSWVSIATMVFCLCYPYYRMATTEMREDQIFYLGNIVPIVAIAMAFLAILSIQKDEELVKSVDRFR